MWSDLRLYRIAGILDALSLCSPATPRPSFHNDIPKPRPALRRESPEHTRGGPFLGGRSEQTDPRHLALCTSLGLSREVSDSQSHQHPQTSGRHPQVIRTRKPVHRARREAVIGKSSAHENPSGALLLTHPWCIDSRPALTWRSTYRSWGRGASLHLTDGCPSRRSTKASAQSAAYQRTIQSP